MRAIAYTRVSTDRQARENLSLDGQEKQIRDYCKASGIELVDLFTDAGESAKTAERPELLKSLEFCRKGEIDLYIVWKLDRFSRNTADHSSMRVLLSKMGVALRSVTEPIDESPTGNLMATILSGFSQFDNEVRGQRSAEGVKRRIEEGGWPHAAPLGYSNVRDVLGRPTIQINETGLILGDFIRDFLKGGMSVQQLHNTISEHGIVSKKGKKINYQTLVNILRNPIYAGMAYSKMIEAPVEGLHPGILTKKEFSHLQSMLDGRNRKFEVANKLDWPLRGGFIKCDDCGNSITGSSPRGRKKSYPQYHCTRCSARALGHRVSTPRTEMHQRFTSLLEEVRPSDVHIKLFKEVFVKRWKEVHEAELVEQARLSASIEQLRARKSRVVELFIDGSLSRVEKEEQVLQIETDIFKQELALSDNHDDVTTAAGVIDFGTELMHNAPNLWKSADLKNRQRLQQAIFPDGLSYSFVDGFGTAKTSNLYVVVEQLSNNNSNLVGLDRVELSTKWL
jgi:site-specific DNA recombinase